MISPKPIKASTLSLAAIAMIHGASISFADGFTPAYANQDMLLSFRQSVAGAPGTYDVTYDLGNVNTFISTYGDERVQLNSASFSRPNAFDASLLTGAAGANYGSLNNLFFSVAATDFSAGVDDMWVTRVRGSNPDNTVADSIAWTDRTAFSQSGASGKIGSVGANAQNFGLTLSPTAIRTTDASATSYNAISSGGTFNNYFTPTTEGATGTSFALDDVIRLDFYEVKHTTTGTAPANYVGYFEFKGNGDMSFVGAQAVPEPSTYALLGLGAAAVAGHKLRQRKAK